MAFKRATVPAAEVLSGDALTSAMVGIGMLFAAAPSPEPDIEDTIIAASVEGMERDDLRVLALLVTWLGVHHARINADKLVRSMEVQLSERVRAFWASVARWLAVDRRFARLERHCGPDQRVDLLSTGTELQMRRRGEDARFAQGPLRVPAGVLRDRQTDVLSPAALARRHTGYRYRVLMGPSYRADMWALLDRDPSLSAAALARRARGSFATGWQVKRDRDLLGDSPGGGVGEMR